MGRVRDSEIYAEGVQVKTASVPRWNVESGIPVTVLVDVGEELRRDVKYDQDGAKFYDEDAFACALLLARLSLRKHFQQEPERARIVAAVSLAYESAYFGRNRRLPHRKTTNLARDMAQFAAALQRVKFE